MRKKVLFLIFSLLPHAVSGAEDNALKLRTSYNPGYTRIVLEGPEPVISRAIVNQTGQDILVTFLRARISVQAEKPAVSYRTMDNNKIMFSPGKFSGMKVLTLRNPDRLVIDVFQEKQRDENMNPSGAPFAKGGRAEIPASDRKEAAGHSGQKNEAAAKTVLIDPGHGGFESGEVTDEYAEKNVVLDISKKLGALIDKGSMKSTLTRSSDLFMSMGERARIANSEGTDIFISLHVGSHKGIVIYMPMITESVKEDIRTYLYNKGQEAYLKKTVTLLNAVKGAMAADFGSDMVTVRPLPYSILSKIEAAALMIELPAFGYANYTEDFKLQVANSINKGIYLYEENEAK
jgi:N-acetylmuramoyl-L-alanine amidase